MNEPHPNPKLPGAFEREPIRRARAFAEAAHEAISHRRKYTGEPYTAHLARVARTVAIATDDEQVIAAAWLHDVVEDTPTTLADVEREFGPGIAALVAALTDVPREAGNRRQRKALDRALLTVMTEGDARLRVRAEEALRECRRRLSGRFHGGEK